ncbi:MAG: hypothetical protein A2X86_17610 [Bdellovibrionales bacterium GWA2_49_15]|nr:MAG: hypothetical protein A2X86_17610 [Bdellovibrionales bacterium GWA2_49_15]HAZ14195.1 hypothetical protein [Bdellovibrionales bacterium]
MLIKFGALIIIFCAAKFSWAQIAARNSCLNCHNDYAAMMSSSIHFKEQIFCNSCHGGNPALHDQKSAHDRQRGYVGVPEKKIIPLICGSCHADVERMNFFGIPTDQLAQYRTSDHGKGLFQKGMTDVAVCTDCHGHHDVVQVGDPNAPVYPLNIPTTCEQCHGNEKLMNRHGLPFDIPEKYKKSVHGKALLEKNDLGSAQCVSCHGSHGAHPPRVNNIVSACGKCHVKERQFFSESVHASLAEAGKFPECISCHNNHEIKVASLEIYEQMCLKCHLKTDPALKRGSQILSLLQDSERLLKASALLVKQAGIDGLFVEDEQALLEVVNTNTLELGPLQHTLDLIRISKHHADLKNKNNEINSLIVRKYKDRHLRTLVLVFIWAFILLMMLALWKRYKQYTRPK